MRLGWTVWLLAIVLSFALLETYALQHDRATFSRYVWEISQAWPPLPFFVGLLVGFLACHFWWQWNPKAHTPRRP